MAWWRQAFRYRVLLSQQTWLSKESRMFVAILFRIQAFRNFKTRQSRRDIVKIKKIILRICILTYFTKVLSWSCFDFKRLETSRPDKADDILSVSKRQESSILWFWKIILQIFYRGLKENIGGKISCFY